MSPRVLTRTASGAALMFLAALSACAESSITEPTETPVASVVVSPPAQTLVVGQQLTLQAKPRAHDGQDLDRAVSWASENEALAQVSSSGVVTTIAVGTVGIRATSGGRFGRAVITIDPVPPVPVAEVRLSADEEIVLEWNGSTSISATALDAEGNVLEGRVVEWQTNRASVATVENGQVTARGTGLATVTAVVEGVPASVGVRVKLAPVTEVFIDANTTGMEIGEVFVFGSRMTRANGETTYGPASWSSSNTAVARVDHEDIWYASVAALAEGTFTLTATAEGVSASLTLTVTQRPAFDLVFNRWKDVASEIFTLDLASVGATPVKVNAGDVSREPSPSPDGTQLVFSVSQVNPTTGGWQHDLYIVNRNGMNMRWLTRTDGIEEQPKWSPDGSKILFRGMVGTRADLFTVNVDGSGLTNLTEAMSAEFTDKRQPSWSFDNTRIAFIAVKDGRHKVWTVNASGGNLTQVTNDVGFDEQPAFSPDGATIAFHRYNATNNSFGNDIMLVSSQGGTPTRITLPGDQRSPVWSPDAKFIALTGTVVAGQGVSQIYTMRPDGTGLRLRTVNPAWEGGVAPAWIARP